MKKMTQREVIVSLWRGNGRPPLYWRSSNRNWRCWKALDVARCRVSAGWIHFTSLDAIYRHMGIEQGRLFD